MALPALATLDDLGYRGVDTLTNAPLAARLLASASEAVRSAARHPILRTTSTVDLQGPSSPWLPLPAPPVSAVSAVAVDGASVTGWRLFPGGRLLHPDGTGCQWSAPGCLSLVTVTYTHGLVEVPADVVDLVCGLVAGALSRVSGGYDPGIGVVSVQVDDAQEQYAVGADARSGAMELPHSTRAWLESRFASPAYVVGMT